LDVSKINSIHYDNPIRYSFFCKGVKNCIKRQGGRKPAALFSDKVCCEEKESNQPEIDRKEPLEILKNRYIDFCAL
jgi:hypothetical protein